MLACTQQALLLVQTLSCLPMEPLAKWVTKSPEVASAWQIYSCCHMGCQMKHSRQETACYCLNKEDYLMSAVCQHLTQA